LFIVIPCADDKIALCRNSFRCHDPSLVVLAGFLSYSRDTRSFQAPEVSGQPAEFLLLSRRRARTIRESNNVLQITT
jgi:hypothetical protein